jgi:hypothetical protein
MISAYLDALAGKLSFDRALSRRVRQEVEDHLCEALAADPAGDRLEAERRAVAKFGPPEILAAEFAAISLARYTRRTVVGVVLAVGGVMATMKVRVAWYAAAQSTIDENWRALGGVLLSLDRIAFWLAAVVGAAAFAYAGRARILAARDPASRRRLRLGLALSVAATVSLVASVTVDGLLTALHAGPERWAALSIPVISLVVEIVCVGALVAQTLVTARRAASISDLLKIQ